MDMWIYGYADDTDIRITDILIRMMISISITVLIPVAITMRYRWDTARVTREANIF